MAGGAVAQNSDFPGARRVRLRAWPILLTVGSASMFLFDNEHEHASLSEAASYDEVPQERLRELHP
jgi:hypothetical protein